MKLTKTEFESEKRYQGLMHFVRKMLNEDLISEDEYRAICEDYALRLYPKTGTLLSTNDLLFCR